MTLVSEFEVCNTIVGLLAFGRPSNIAGLVITIVVDSVKSSVIRTFAHVSEEILKPSPASADRNVATPVILIRWATWVSTSRDHILPRSICWGSSALGWASVAMNESACHMHILPLGNAIRCRCGG